MNILLRIENYPRWTPLKPVARWVAFIFGKRCRYFGWYFGSIVPDSVHRCSRVAGHTRSHYSVFTVDQWNLEPSTRDENGVWKCLE